MAETLLTVTGFTDTSGNPLVGGKVYGFEPGTSSPKSTYPTRNDAENDTNPNAHPVILDDYGWAQIWLSGRYKIQVDTASDTTVRTIDQIGDISEISTLARNEISDLITSNNSGNPNTDVDIAQGECRDFANTIDMILTSTLTKKIDTNWAEGNNAGGFPPSLTLTANTRYNVFLIAKPDATVDAGFDTSDTASNLLSAATDYTKYRLVGSVYVDVSSNIVAFIQIGDFFRYLGSVIADIADSSLTTLTFETGVLSAPPNCEAHVYVHLVNTDGTANQSDIYLRPVGAGDEASATQSVLSIETSGTFDRGATKTTVLLNASSQMQYATRFTGGTPSLSIGTAAFTMLTRRDPV